MTNSRVTGVRSVELGVRDLHQSADFYTKVWALEEVPSQTDCMHFRATGGEHHVLTIRERSKPALLGVHFAANDRAAVDALCAQAKSYGVDIEAEPGPLDRSAGGGYGFRFRTPDGLPMSISSDLVQHPSVVLDGAVLQVGGVSGGLSADELLNPFNIEAVEVYPSAAGVPVQYGGYMSPCGAIVAWSRR